MKVGIDLPATAIAVPENELVVGHVGLALHIVVGRRIEDHGVSDIRSIEEG